MRTQYHLRRSTRGERGAVLIIVAVFAIVAVLMLAAVVDLGGQREQRKELTLSTDAAALAAAGLADTEDPDVLAEPNGTPIDCVDVGIAAVPNPNLYTDVQDAVNQYLKQNGTPEPAVACKVVRTSAKEGYVVVGAAETVQYAFGSAVGITAAGVNGASVAAIEANPGGGLRPVAICGAMETMAGVTGYPEISLNALSAGPTAGYSLDANGYVVAVSAPSVRTSFTARFPIELVKGGPCTGFSGGGSGNFGKLDFGGATSTSCTEIGHFCKDYKDGYFGPVTSPVKGDTGNDWSSTANEDSTENLETNVGQFWAPVFSTAVGPGGNADFTITHYAQFEMVNHCFTGGCKFDGTTWFDFRVTRMIPFVQNGIPPKTDDANLKRPTLCAVDNDAAKIAAGCPHVVITGSTLPPSSSTSSSSSSSSSSSTPSSSTPTCAVTSVTLDPVSVATSGNKVSSPVKVTVNLQTPTNCTGLVVEMVEDKNNGSVNRILDDYSPPSSTTSFEITVPAGAGTYGNNSKFNVVVRQGSTELDYSPIAVLDT